MRYLLFAEFEANPTDDDTMRFQYEVFLDHSAKYWAAHIRESYIDVDSTATQSMLRLCDTSSTCCQTWFRLYWTSTNTEFSENFAVLMIASYLFGPTTVVKHLLLQLDSTDLNCKDSTHGRSAISWAAGNGFDEVVRQVIKGIGSRLKGSGDYLGKAFKSIQWINMAEHHWCMRFGIDTRRSSSGCLGQEPVAT